MNTGDSATIRKVYPAVRRYLERFPLDSTGLTAAYKATWLWGDWGDNRDIRLIFAGWHYMALDAMARMADMMGLDADAAQYRATMEQIKKGYNHCWNGYSYRHPQYMGATDDRVQALAVISGIADESKYGEIFNVLKTQEYASPYMERYVMEALFQMGQGDYAMRRLKKRIAPMVNDKDYPTLWEFWDARKRGFRGGSSNHAWSGGGSPEAHGRRDHRPLLATLQDRPAVCHLRRGESLLPHPERHRLYRLQARQSPAHHVGGRARQDRGAGLHPLDRH